jgi:ribosomal protein S18 acetylase RimI-like enzyme
MTADEMMRDAPVLRRASERDIPAMLRVINAAFAIETFLEGTRTDKENLEAMMRKGDFVVGCNSSGDVLASVYVEVRGRRGYFGMLAVDPAHQGRGLGRALVEAAEKHCRCQGCEAIDITILSLRAELPPFYRKLGYEEIGTEEFRPSRALQGGLECHCIVMSKKL